ncbi:MAG: hypothetical protein EOO27_00945 [Comamonadaceae bacterium]|nr:MAG: hypothetical protein EOO27_00945 [Comamonadaceae bacterium]
MPEAIAEAAEPKTDGPPPHDPAAARDALLAIQSVVAGLPPVTCEIEHAFLPGVYVRTVRIPAGTSMVGKIHKHPHISILSQGDVSVFSEQAGSERFSGPRTITSPAGMKRAIHAHTDVVWTVIHLTNETDLEKIEREVVANTYAEYEQYLSEAAKAVVH